MDKQAIHNWGLMRAAAKNGGMTHDMAHMVARGWKGIPRPPSPLLQGVKQLGGAANAFTLRHAKPLASGLDLVANYGDDAMRAAGQLGGAFNHFAQAGGQHALSMLGLG